MAAHRRDQGLDPPLRADLALVLVIVGDVAQGPGRRLLHARALGVAAHRRDQGLDPPLRVCA